MNERTAVDTWIYSTLKADAALTNLIGGAAQPRIYIDQAPQEKVGVTLYPYVLFQMQSAIHLNIVGPRRFWCALVYLVRGVHETGSYGAPLLTIAERIDALLHATPVGVTNTHGIVWDCVGEQLYGMPETVNGRNFRNLGTIFRIHASQTT